MLFLLFYLGVLAINLVEYQIDIKGNKTEVTVKRKCSQHNLEGMCFPRRTDIIPLPLTAKYTFQFYNKEPNNIHKLL